MPKPKKSFQETMERVRSSYLRRGFKIVGSNDSPVVVVKERPPAKITFLD